MANSLFTLDHYVQRIINFVEGGRSTNEDTKSPRQIAFDIHQMRSLLLRREEINLDLRPFQQSHTLQLQAIDNRIKEEPSMIQGFISENEGTVFKSITSIPKIIDFKYKQNIEVHSSIFNPVSIVNFYEMNFHSYNKFSGINVVASYNNGNIYLYIPSKIETINQELILNDLNDTNNVNNLFDPLDPITQIDVKAVFENPQDVTSFDKSNDEYPMTNQMGFRILESLIKRYLDEEQIKQDIETNLMEDEDQRTVSN